MVHILDLPGCFVRRANREEALQAVPNAIHEYCAWLERHTSRSIMSGDPPSLKVAEEVQGSGPFDPGDAAALFTPEKEAIGVDEIERFLRLSEFARLDLLALIERIPDKGLDWQPDPETISIRRIIRHIGNVEEWYVSRLVPSQDLPGEWESDERLSLLEFLVMERRNSVACLRQLTAEQRREVFYPTGWTQHPDEPWTLRKVLRRFVEHELEHTSQIDQILSSWRATSGDKPHEDR